MAKRNSNDLDRLAAAVTGTTATIDRSETIMSDSSNSAVPAIPVVSSHSGEPESAPTLNPDQAPAPPPAPAGQAASVAAIDTPSVPYIFDTRPVPFIPVNLTDFVAKLSPDQLAKLRQMAQSAGISAAPRRGPNGGLMVEIEVPAEVCEPFSVWAEAAGEPFADFIRKIAADSMISYCYQDWGEAASAVHGAKPVMPADTMKVPAAGIGTVAPKAAVGA
jgi:hypothetical protein